MLPKMGSCKIENSNEYAKRIVFELIVLTRLMSEENDEGEVSLKYRWLVLVATCIGGGLSYGTLYAVGVLYADWVNYFDAPARSVSLVGSFPAVVACLGGPIYGAVSDRIGNRMSGFLGGFFMFLGLSVSYFANSLFALLFSYGLMTGIGVGLSNIALSAALNAYFRRDRAFAEGASGGGTCCGMFLAATLLQCFSQAYTWKGAMLLTGAYCLHLCFCAIFYVPVADIKHHPLNLWRKKETRFDSSEIKRLAKDEHPDEVKSVPSTSFSLDGGSQPDRDNFLRRSLLLWRRPIFHMILTCNLLSCVAMFVPYVHLVARARQQNVSSQLASWLSSVIGLAGIVGRPLTGKICSYYRLDPLWSYCCFQIIVGAAAVLSPFWSDIGGLFAFAATVGFLGNAYGLMKASAALLLGRDSFVDAYSWMLVTEGIGVGIGPLIAGAIYDVTGTYDWSFRFSGIVLLASAALCFLRTPLLKLEAGRRREKDDDIFGS